MADHENSRRREDGESVPCLVCSTPMRANVVKGVEIDHCIKCGGIWLDKGELQRLTSLAILDRRVLNCPFCKMDLDIMTLSGVEIDICPGCSGIWLDRGELDTLYMKTSDYAVNKFKDFIESLTNRRNLELAKKGMELDSEIETLVLVENIFIVYKSGLLVASFNKKSNSSVDEDILAGMLMSIQNFVKTVFADLGKEGIGSIKFGGREIFMTQGNYLLAAMVLSGEFPDGAAKKMESLVQGIEEKYADKLRKWEGNLEELEGVEEFIHQTFR